MKRKLLTALLALIMTLVPTLLCSCGESSFQSGEYISSEPYLYVNITDAESIIDYSSKIYGIDYSPLCVKKSSRKNRKAIKNGRVEISEASVEALPFENNSIDCAVAVETIYFWNDPDKAFSEIKRVLKPNGSLNIVCEMVKNDDGSGAHTEVAELLKLNYYSKTEIENIFCRNGFVDITSHFDKENTWLMVSGKKNYES